MDDSWFSDPADSPLRLKTGKARSEHAQSERSQGADIIAAFRHFRVGRVEDGRGSLGHAATLRFPSPLIEPDVRISRIRLSDWLRPEAHETNH